MAITRAQLRTSVRTEMKLDRRWKIWDDSEVNEAIDDSISQVAVDNDYRWEELLTTGNDVTVADQQEYDLPSDFVTLDLVRLNGIVLDTTTFKELKTIYQTFPSGSPTHYYDKDYKLGLNPITTTDWTAIDYEYRAAPVPMTDDADTMIYKDNMKRAVVLNASFILFGKFSDQQNLTRAKAKEALYEQELWKAKKRNSLWDIAQIFYKNSSAPVRNRRWRNRFIIN